MFSNLTTIEFYSRMLQKYVMECCVGMFKFGMKWSNLQLQVLNAILE